MCPLRIVLDRIRTVSRLRSNTILRHGASCGELHQGDSKEP